MDKSLKAIGQVGTETLEALAAGLREKYPAESFIRQLVEAKYTHEEMGIVESEVKSLSTKAGNLTSAETRVALFKMIHAKTLNPDLKDDGAKILALNAMQSNDIRDKRLGYLASATLLDSDDQFGLLCVNTIQRDLKSANVAFISLALLSAPRLIPSDVISSVVPAIEHRCQHPDYRVKRRALVCLVAVTANTRNDDDDDNQRELVNRLHGILYAATCDKSFHVTATALQLVESFVRRDPVVWCARGLANVVTHVQTQILRRRIPHGLEIAGIPAPQAQVHILRVMASLLRANRGLAVEFFPVIKETMEHCEVNHRMTYAIVYECVVVIGVALDNGGRENVENDDVDTVALDPSLKTAMLEASIGCIAKFVDSSAPDICYMGFKALRVVMRADAKCVMRFQRQIVASLASEDSSLNRVALDVLVATANPQNSKAILAKVVEALKSRRCDDASFLTGLVLRFSKMVVVEDLWYLDAMIYLLKITDGEGDRRQRVWLTKRDINDVVQVVLDRRSIYEKYASKVLEKLFHFLEKSNSNSKIQFYFVFSLLTKLNRANNVVFSFEATIDSLHSFATTTTTSRRVDAIATMAKCDALSQFLLLLESLTRGTTLSPTSKSKLGSILDHVEKTSRDFPHPLVRHLRKISTADVDEGASSVIVDVSFLEKYAAAALAKGDAPYIPREERGAANRKREKSMAVKEETTKTPSTSSALPKASWTKDGYVGDSETRNLPPGRRQIREIDQEREILASQLFRGVAEDDSASKAAKAAEADESKFIKDILSSSRDFVEEALGKTNVGNNGPLNLAIAENFEDDAVISEDYLNLKKDLINTMESDCDFGRHLSDDSLDDDS